MSNKVEKLAEEARSEFETACAKLSKKDYKEALEILMEHIRDNIECVTAEIEAEGGKDD